MSCAPYGHNPIRNTADLPAEVRMELLAADAGGRPLHAIAQVCRECGVVFVAAEALAPLTDLVRASTGG